MVKKRMKKSILYSFIVLFTVVQLISAHDVVYERFNQAFGTTVFPTTTIDLTSSPKHEHSLNEPPSSSFSSSTTPPESFPNSEHYECINFTNHGSALSTCEASSWRQFNTKTTYLNARRTLIESGAHNNKWPVPDSCRPIYLHFLNRHSIRYPSKKYIREFAERLPELKKFIIDAHQLDDPSLVRTFKDWKLFMNENDDNRVTFSGTYQSAITAQIFDKYFPELLNIESSELEIGVTPKIRTSQTADAFLRSLVESQLMRHGVNESTLKSLENFQHLVRQKMSQFRLVERPVLMSHRYCKAKLEKDKAIIKEMEENEMNTVLKSSGMLTMLKQFSERHHFPGTLDSDTILLMHRACSFETAIYDSSPWCSLFTSNELKFLTYVLDRQEYFDAYALQPYREFGCSFVNDLISKMDHYLSQPPDQRRPKAILDFSHENLLSRIISHFGLYNHCPAMLHSGNEACIPTNRQYQSSLLVPFGANFAFTLYQCQENDGDSIANKILILHNERPVRVNGCDDILCDFEQFHKNYHRHLDHCDLNQICRL